MTSSKYVPDDVDGFRAQRAAENPGVNTEPMAIFGRINRIARRMAPHMEALFAGYDLERGEFDVLATLQRSGPPYTQSPTDLYRSLMITSGGLTHRLNLLEGRGYVARAPSSDDGRSLLVQLTPKGLKKVAAAFVEDMRLEQSWLAGLSIQERETLASLLRRLYASIPEYRREPKRPVENSAKAKGQNRRRRRSD